jgi:hypothetical protein
MIPFDNELREKIFTKIKNACEQDNLCPVMTFCIGEDGMMGLIETHSYHAHTMLVLLRDMMSQKIKEEEAMNAKEAMDYFGADVPAIGSTGEQKKCACGKNDTCKCKEKNEIPDQHTAQPSV